MPNNSPKNPTMKRPEYFAFMFAHIAQDDPQFVHINQKNFVFNSGLMGVFEVGKV